MVRHNSLSWGQCEVPRPVETTQMEKYRQRRNTLGATLGPRQPVRSGRPRQPQEGRASDKWETMQVLRFNSVCIRRKSWALCTGILNKMPNCIQTVWRSTPHSTPHHTPHFPNHTPHSTFHTPNFRLHTSRSPLHTLHSPLHTSHITLHTLHSTLPAPHFTLSTPHSTLHTLHFTLHTSNSTLHTSKITA